LLEAGAAVAFSDVDESGLAEAVAAASDRERALPLVFDVTSEQAVVAAFDRVVRHWGGIDFVVCNAGIAIPFELVDFPLDKWHLSLDVNLTGYFLVAREGARIMRAQGTGGAMVMITSKAAMDATKGQSAYNATKAGQQHMMRGWALELGRHGIRVNAIAPGFVFEGSKIWSRDYIENRARGRGIKPEEVVPFYVSLSALNREIKPADIGAAAVFLCSEKSRSITGQTLVVDGGVTMVR
jgi:NAD(P)-dependent dehydrogenase (short-subunit alcohol dehydrogenase family)